MTEMVERVARAIAEASPQQFSHAHAVKLARAAIAAMREPTMAMLFQGSVTHPDLPFSQTADVWQAMIDAALSG